MHFHCKTRLEHPGRSHVGTMIDARCRSHDGRDALVAAEGRQSTPGQPDQVDLARTSFGDLQSAKHVESTPQCKLRSFGHGTLECVDDANLVEIVGCSSNVGGSLRWEVERFRCGEHPNSRKCDMMLGEPRAKELGHGQDVRMMGRA